MSLPQPDDGSVDFLFIVPHSFTPNLRSMLKTLSNEIVPGKQLPSSQYMRHVFVEYPFWGENMLSLQNAFSSGSYLGAIIFIDEDEHGSYNWILQNIMTWLGAYLSLRIYIVALKREVVTMDMLQAVNAFKGYTARYPLLKRATFEVDWQQMSSILQQIITRNFD